ncbi:MAG: protein kinase [Myxococcota bacterium]
MDSQQYARLLPRLEAFVEGRASADERREIELLLDRSDEARALVGALARSRQRTAGPKAADPLVGLTIEGRYRVIRRLGEGGMGAVYEAEHRWLGRSVALKVLRSRFGIDSEVRRRFEGEARAAATLEHENIVRALDVGRMEDGVPFIVYEYLKGQDLDARMRAEALTPAEAVAVIATLAEALSVAHARGIVHRDVKPANVMLLEGSRVPKLIDFGISKLESSAMATRTGASMGTPAYMAPEQLVDASRVDGRADVYSLGVMLFQLVAGDLPFRRPALGPRAVPALPRGPSELDPVLMRCLAYRREERCTAQELADALSSLAFASPAMPQRQIVLAVRSDAGLQVFGESGWKPQTVGEAWAACRAGAHGLVIVASTYVSNGQTERVEALSAAFEAAKAQGIRGILVAKESASLLPCDVEPSVIDGYLQASERIGNDVPAFVGRTFELQVLEAALRQVSNGSGALMQVLGPPGIGKTRLLEEAIAIAHGLGVRWTRYALTPADALTGEDARSSRARVQHAQKAFHEGLLAAPGATLVLVDRADELGEGELRFVESLAASPRVLVLAASRSALAWEGVARELTLGALSRTEVERMAPALDPDALERLVARSEGNPLFVQYLSRSKLDGDTLHPGIEAALRARLDGLPESARALLLRLSVFGDRSIERPWLDALGDANESDIDALRRARLVRAGDTPRSLRIATHALSATSLASLTVPARQQAHRRVAEALCDLPNIPAVIVAEHFDGADERGAAGQWYARAALDAYAAGAFARARTSADAARRLGEDSFRLASAMAYVHELTGRFDDEAAELTRAVSLSESPADRALTGARQAVVAFRAGEWKDAEQQFEAAIKTAPTPAVEAQCRGKYAAALAFHGAIDRALVEQHAMERLVAVHAPELRAEAAQWTGQVSVCQGDYAGQRQAYWVVRELLEERGDRQRSAQAALNLADSYNRLGAYDHAATLLLQALATSAALLGSYGKAYAHINLAYAQLHLDQLDEAGMHLAMAEPLLASNARLTGLHRLYGLRLRRRRGDAVGESAIALANDERVTPTVRALAWSVASEATDDSADALAFSGRAMSLVAELGALEEDTARVWATRLRALHGADRAGEARELRAVAAASILAHARRIGEPLWQEHFLRHVEAHRYLLSESLATPSAHVRSAQPV